MLRTATILILIWTIAVGASLVIADAAATEGHSTPDLPAITPGPRTAPIFIFHTDEFWLNLHHFLYVLGRVENKERDAGREAVKNAPAEQDAALTRLNAKEGTTWREAVAWYAAGPSKKDLIFDDDLSAITERVAAAGSAKTAVGVDSVFAAVLERAAPVYRKAWWPRHHAANRAWVAETEVLVQKYGAQVLAFILDRYRLAWPAKGYPIHVSGFANWAGAYSVTDRLLVVSSLSVGNKGPGGMESVFHESMHQWDVQIEAALEVQAKAAGQPVPGGLSHALIFYTAGEAVRRVVPNYTTFAETAGIWQRGLARFKPILDEVWKPYLDGHGTRDEAFAKLIRRSAVPPSKP
jgi:hypothetical protein